MCIRDRSLGQAILEKHFHLWLQPAAQGDADFGGFRLRFELGTRDLVDKNCFPKSVSERIKLMIFEHVLCQIENLLPHPFVASRVQAQTTSFYGWVVDGDSARVFGFSPEESAFVLI